MIQWKTVLALAQQSSVCIYLSRRCETIKTKMIVRFEMQHSGIMRLQLLQEQNQTKCFFLLNGSLFYSHTPKKGHRFQLMKQGIESEVRAGYGLTMMAWGPNLTQSLCCSLHGGISHSRPWLPSITPPNSFPLPPTSSSSIHSSC